MEETEQIGLLRQLLSLPFDIFSIKDAEFVQGRPTEYLTGFMWSIKETDLNPGFSLDPIDQIMVAEAVLGAPGLVYSPHQEGMLVDVKRFQAGEEVICPHSGLKFLVPDNVQPTLNIGDPFLRLLQLMPKIQSKRYFQLKKKHRKYRKTRY